MKPSVKAFKSQAAFIAKMAARKQRWELTHKPVCLHMIYSPPDRRRRDLSNIIKVAEDAMSGILYADDCQVVRIVLEKTEKTPRGGLKVCVSIDGELV